MLTWFVKVKPCGGWTFFITLIFFFRNSLGDFDPFGSSKSTKDSVEVVPPSVSKSEDNGTSFTGDRMSGDAASSSKGDSCQQQQSESVFDQILDLSCEPVTKTTTTAAATTEQQPLPVMIGAPIIAFEEASNNSDSATLTNVVSSPPQAQEVPTGGIL